MSNAREKIAHYIKPMLATAVDDAFNSKEWLYELKFDGYRAIAEIKKGKILLYSRNGLSLAQRYPVIVSAVKKIKHTCVLDGEIVLLNEKGKPDFQKLQNYEQNKGYPLVYYVFDLLSLKGKETIHLPLTERKQLLKKIIKKNDIIIYSDHIETKGEDFFQAITRDDLEGIMAKKKDSLYFPGDRTKNWLKIKNKKTQEAIIVGFTEPKGSRLHFGSILLAQRKGKKLVYVGHAGTGFSDKTLTVLMKKMKPLATSKSPFETFIKTNAPVTWIKPKLVCEISYTEVTEDGILRHPVFKGLRPEKKSAAIQQATERSIPVKEVV